MTIKCLNDQSSKSLLYTLCINMIIIITIPYACLITIMKTYLVKHSYTNMHSESWWCGAGLPW